MTISDQNLVQYGFSCFFYRGEQLLRDGFWEREIEIARGGKESPEKVTFRIPEEQLICLSKNNKIAAHPNFEIDATPDPIPAIKLLSERAGWNQTLGDLQAMYSLTADGTFAARYQCKDRKIVLGSGVSLPVSEDLGWIGMILVHPELRRQGIARSIMHHCLRHARIGRQRAIVGLDATPLGKQVYDSLGFRDSFLIWRTVLSTSEELPKSSSCEVMPMDQKSVIDYLYRRNYTERSALIELVSQLPGSFNLQAKKNGEVCAIALSRPGRLKPFVGTLIADTPDVATDLIAGIIRYWREEKYDEVFFDIPEWHLDGRSIFNIEQGKGSEVKGQIPVSPVRSLMRMYQLIAPDELADIEASEMSDDLIKSSIEGFEQTATFMNKEKNELVPIMYSTSGPEWS